MQKSIWTVESFFPAAAHFWPAKVISVRGTFILQNNSMIYLHRFHFSFISTFFQMTFALEKSALLTIYVIVHHHISLSHSHQLIRQMEFNKLCHPQLILCNLKATPACKKVNGHKNNTHFCSAVFLLETWSKNSTVFQSVYERKKSFVVFSIHYLPHTALHLHLFHEIVKVSHQLLFILVFIISPLLLSRARVFLFLSFHSSVFVSLSLRWWLA